MSAASQIVNRLIEDEDEDKDLDASAEVKRMAGQGDLDDISFRDLDTFTIAYLVAALWSSTDQSNEQGGEPMDKNYDVADISQATLRQAKADCEAFQRDNAEDLELWNSEQAGHDFWLTRCGHGAGFWDRGHGESGERLTSAAEVYGNIDLYIGDDGEIYSA